MRSMSYYIGHFLLYLGFLILALVIAWLILKVSRINVSYQLTTRHLAALETAVRANPSDLELIQAKESLRSMSTSLDILYEELTPFLPLTPYLGWVPVYGGDLRALPYLVTVTRDLSQTGMIIAEILSPLPGSEEPLAYLAASLAWAEAGFEQTELLLRQHQAMLRQLDVERLSPQTEHRVKQLDRYLPQAISGLQLARSLPTLLGAESPRTYLILTQNSDELRPSGGYINTAGHLVIDKGRIVEFVMQDSYEIDQISEDYPYPPDPLYKYMAAEYWVLRDASWSPDYPTTAHTAMKLYELGQDISVDGVIAIDQYALPYLVRPFEPIQVEEDQVTSDNVIDLMRQHWAPEVGRESDNAWWSQRKSFMVVLAEAFRQELEQNVEKVDLLALARSLAQTLAEKHILVYLKDSNGAGFFTEQNWSGALQSAQGDFLMVVDGNVGFNKASAMVDRHVTYRIKLAEDGSVRAHATLTYQHRAEKRRGTCSIELRYDPIYEQNMARCYWNYMQIVVPSAANLVSGPNLVVEGEYLLRGQPTTGEIDAVLLGSDRVGWGQLFLLAPGESLTLDYVYTLPPGTSRIVDSQWAYNLYLQKQPGTIEPSVEVIVDLPEGAQLISSLPLPASQQGTVSTYWVNLDTDQELEIRYTYFEKNNGTE